MYKICPLFPLFPFVPLVYLLGTLLLCQDPSISAPWCLQTDPFCSLSNPSILPHPKSRPPGVFQIQIYIN